MRTLTAFNFISINGFFKGANEDISWHRHGEEEGVYSQEMLQQENILLFGRKTYEMMAGYWTSPVAFENDPIVSSRMNQAEKMVFSSSLTNAAWAKTTIINNPIAEIKKIKGTPGKNMTILGSGTIVTQFAEAGLIDAFQLMIDPVALKEGTPFLNGIQRSLNLQLINFRTFKSGVVLLYYRPE